MGALKQFLGMAVSWCYWCCENTEHIDGECVNSCYHHFQEDGE